jgi:hypothetical protein
MRKYATPFPILRVYKEERADFSYQLKQIKNKKVRAYYEEQNRRLDDWLEVDMIVMSLADDVLDSMDPQDPDGDGVAEERGPLGISAENVECFLPDDEREKRRKSARNVRWAINVRVVTGGALLEYQS